MRIDQALVVFTAVLSSRAAPDLGYESDDDLLTSVTRPEFKSPRFDITLYDPENVTPGYWFVAPYLEINQRPVPPGYYQSCQIGPHIYDEDGDLVYSGACRFRNQNMCDWRAWNFSGTSLLSGILYQNSIDPVGRAIIMDSSYKILHELTSPSTEQGLNMHEFNLVDGGKTALFIAHRTEYVDISALGESSVGHRGYIVNVGIRAVNVASGETMFQWWAYPDVSLAESTAPVRMLQGPFPSGYNWFHGNSIDKNADGDYLISSRYTNTIYKIASTGEIVWRLGGINSDFTLSGFNFSRQHDAHWVEYSSAKEIITLLDNAGDENIKTSEMSSALKIELDLPTKTAKVLQRWIRPDEGQSLLRGNFQSLSSGNYLAAWSDNAYTSEHSADGRLLAEAEFASRRLVSYRAYKMSFTGQPEEDPVLKAYVYGTDATTSTTVTYVSWNGATEVSRWRFYNSAGLSIGDTKRKGYETRFFSTGAESSVYAEAISADGEVLGRSNTFKTQFPEEWQMDEGGVAADEIPGGAVAIRAEVKPAFDNSV